MMNYPLQPIGPDSVQMKTDSIVEVEDEDQDEDRDESPRPGSVPATLPTLEELLQKRERVIQIIHQLDELKEEVSKIAGGLKRGYFFDHYHDRHKKDRIRKTDIAFWEHVIYVYGLSNSMTEKAKVDWMEKITNEAPSFNEANCLGFVQNMEAKYNQAKWETVKEVYKQLIGCRYDGPNRTTKKDNLQGVGPQFRCRGNICRSSWSGRFEYREDWRHGLNYDDVLTACFLLEGRGKPNYGNNLYGRAREAFADGGDTLETDFFTIKCYKNGNQKITWKEDKLPVLEKLNKYGSEGGLPDPLKKRYKPEHFNGKHFNFNAAREQFSPAPKEDYFWSPECVTARACELAELEPGMLVLEPEAGGGHLAAAVSEVIGPENLRCYELHAGRAAALAETYRVDQVDFLSVTPEPVYDRVVMNPPFSLQADIYHVLHALDFLKPVGRLVSVMAAGIETRENALAKHFRGVVSERGGWYEDIPEGAFKEAGTAVRTVLVVIPGKEGG